MAAANEPKSVKVHQSSGNGMDIEWKDGHQSHYTFSYLRDACPCAVCNEEREKSGRQIGDSAKTAPAALPMFKPLPRPTEAAPSGHYGIRFKWNDGHEHGIYSWHYLREWCPCEQCKMSRESVNGLAEDIAEHEQRKPN